MPLSRFPKYNKYRGKRKRYTRYTRSTGTAQRALKLARYAVKKTQVENKYIDTKTAGPTAITQNPAATLSWDLNVPVLGAENYKRIGNIIYNKSFHATVDLNHNSAGSTIQRVHVLVVNYVNSGTLSTNMNQLFTSSSIFEPFRNMEYLKHYRVLFSKTYTLDKDNRRIAHAKIYKKLNFRTKFVAGNGNYQDITQGLVQLFMWSDVAANQPTYSALNMRYTFQDA